MICSTALSQEAINLINENNSRLEFVSQAKHSSHCHNQVMRFSGGFNEKNENEDINYKDSTVEKIGQ